MSWLDEVKALGSARVAHALGMTQIGKGWGPCPNPGCERERRGSERRGAVGMGDRGGWACHLCKASGDAVDLLSVKLFGRKFSELSPSERTETQEDAKRRGLLSGPAPAPYAVRTPKRSQMPEEGPTIVPAGSTIAPDWPDGTSIGKLPWSDQLPSQFVDRLWVDPDADPVRRYLQGGIGEGPGGINGRRLSEAAIRAYKLGAYRDSRGQWWVSIPLLDPRGRPVNIKFRRLPLPDGTPEGKLDGPKYMVFGDRPLTLFGAKSLPNDKGAQILVCEGELDVVAAYDFGYQSGVVSGTAGADQSWPEAWLDLLEGYRHVVICTDDDEAGDRAAERLVGPIGKDRCSRARFLYKDMGECLLRGVDADEVDIAIERAESFVAVKIRKIGHYRAELMGGRRDPKRLMGLPTGSRKLDEMIGGIPVGLTVISGPEGTGKSTFCSWLLWEQAKRGVPSLLTVFENDASPAWHKFVRMRLEADFFKTPPDLVDQAITDIDHMPIHNVDHYGRLELDPLMEAIRYSVRRHGIKVVLIDHLGFMLDTSREDTTRQIDHIVRALVTLARSEKIAILLIAHPRDPAPGYKGRVTSKMLKGATSIRQDAAVVLIVEKNLKSQMPSATIHCDKQRGDWGQGEGSSRDLAFGLNSCLYADDGALLPLADGYALSVPPAPLDTAALAAGDRGEDYPETYDDLPDAQPPAPVPDDPAPV